MNKVISTLTITSLAFVTSQALAGQTNASNSGTQSMPANVQMMMNLGAAGLLTKLASFEEMSVTQGRLGASRAQVEYSRATGITEGFKDSTEVLVLPVDLLYTASNSGGQSFYRSSAIRGDYNAIHGDLTEVDTELNRVDFQYFRSPNMDMLYGLGAYIESADSDLKHLGGSTDRFGLGIRADLLHKTSDNWGYAIRADIGIGTSDTAAPVGPAGILSYELDDTRVYIQADLVGSYMQHHHAKIPAGWMFRPMAGLVYQNTDFDTTTSNFGTQVTGTAGTSESYASIAFNARLESTNYRPMALIPYFELGVEQELLNDVDDVLEDKSIIHSVVGSTLLFGRGARLDLQYSRHDGLDSLRRDQALVAHIGLTF